uniref:Glycosyl transferase CAP10 domain-containing protein n=2 Tax=Ditylum brightwellii TaxID=49249 RepID=A0A6V2ELU9_9STRA|mmetsp:Transcript_3410/g.5251  ORF Transcript_3410/g.5251 Transcript_3410/m.5251 type:complete len:690 (+) Transcript_3410:278-2347(+)
MASPKPPEIRGMLGPKGDSEDWLEAVSSFPNGVPRFDSRADCIKFMEDYNTYHGGSNPDNPRLMHIFTMLTSWDQVEKYLLPNIEKARKEPSFVKKVERDYLDDLEDELVAGVGTDQAEVGGEGNGTESNNAYENPPAYNVVRDVEFRLDLPIHKCTTPESTMNTLKYLFFHMKCGIFVMIRNGELRIFAPFVNGDYRNTWGDILKLEGDDSLDTYYSKKAGLYREEQVERDRFKWWANGNIICNELTQDKDKTAMQYWGDHFLAPLRDMLGEACRERNIPDCEFFLNKRDYPQLKVNIPRGGIPVEPYGFIFDKDDRKPSEDVDLVEEHKFDTYAPIVSFYAAKPTRFSDIPWPSSEDWEAACGLVFPQTFMHKKDKQGNAKFDSNPRDLFTEANFRQFERGWDDNRVATAFFRGTATGGGTTIHNNQRLMVAYLAHEWKNDEEKGGPEPFLDAAIVGWNMRDKKISSSPMTFLRKSEFGFTAGKQHFTPIYEQSKYKYLVYVDGHCAACRYGFMMRLGSVILKVAPRQVADTMWYFPLLKPYVDHVPVKADLSDLEDKIRWCRQNDEKCRQIGENAKLFYEKYVGRKALLDYVEMCCKQMSKRFVNPPEWWADPPPELEPPKLRKPDDKCDKDRFCVRCQEQIDEEERVIRERIEREKAEKGDLKKRKMSHRERMRAKAAAAKKKKT